MLGQQRHRWEMVELVEQGEPVEPGHLYVQEDGADVPDSQLLDGGTTVGGLVDDVARCPQDLGTGRTDVAVVVHHEHVQRQSHDHTIGDPGVNVHA